MTQKIDKTTTEYKLRDTRKAVWDSQMLLEHQTTTEYKLRDARKDMILYDAVNTVGRKFGIRGWYFTEPKWDLGEFDF